MLGGRQHWSFKQGKGLCCNSVEDALLCRRGGLRCANTQVLVYVACWYKSCRLCGICALVLVAAQALTPQRMPQARIA